MENSSKNDTLKYANGDVFEGTFKDNKPHIGKVLLSNGEVGYNVEWIKGDVEIRTRYDSYYDDAKLKPMEKCYYKDGEVIKKQEYHESGQIASNCALEGGEPHGRERKYFEDGIIKIDIDWKEGKKHGKELEYSESGHIKTEIEWIEGKKIKQLKYHYESEKIKMELNWKDSKKHGKHLNYYENGNIKTDLDWIEGK